MASSLQIAAYLRVAAYAVAFFDYLQSLPAEYRLYAKQKGPFKLSLAGILFILMRYLGLISIIIGNTGFFHHGFSKEACDRYFSLAPIFKRTWDFFQNGIQAHHFSMLLYITSQAILAIRTYAVSRKSPMVLRALVVLFIVTAVPEFISTFWKRVPFQNNVLPILPASSCSSDRIAIFSSLSDCTSGNLPGVKVASLYYVGGLVFDVVTMLMTSTYLWKFSSTSRTSLSQLARMMLQDGIMYFIALSGMNVVNLIFFQSKDTVLQPSASTLGFAATMIFSSRFILGLSEHIRVGVSGDHSNTSRTPHNGTNFRAANHAVGEGPELVVKVMKNVITMSDMGRDDDSESRSKAAVQWGADDGSMAWSTYRDDTSLTFFLSGIRGSHVEHTCRVIKKHVHSPRICGFSLFFFHCHCGTVDAFLGLSTQIAAMHRALHVPEIVAMICREIIPSNESGLWRSGWSSSDTLATLATTARICKTFSGPALDLLWMNQLTLKPLLNCTPEDVWAEPDSDDDEEEDNRMGLARAVLPADWDRPLVYAHRVKYFHFDDREYGSVEPRFFEELPLCLPGEYLLPNLESLDWYSEKPSSLPHARLFLGRRLKFLTLGLFASAAHLSSLPTLAAQCPSLVDVEISMSDELELHLLPLPHSPMPPNSTIQALFTSLASLIVTGSDASGVFDLLSHPPIDHIEAFFPKSTTADTITKCYSALTRLRVCLAPPVGIDLHNAIVLELAQAWPHLKSLRFGASDYAHVPSRVTLDGLLPFAEHCPHLYLLQIPLDASVVPAWADQTTRQKRITHKRLTRLRLTRSPILVPLAVAGYLSSIFPKLRSEAIVLHKRWKDVEFALPLLHTVRAEERYWTQRGKK
ncbi:hypothetical protein DFH09DRAFT_1455163 [Mycena vulgaris]|nr:hypothetical protein DFH09DRAFT_1455163 [Mycena vulgaris]